MSIPRSVRRSAAWRVASEKARKVLIVMASQYDGRNNGQLVFDGNDGRQIGLSPLETEIALFELERLGLVDSQERGSRQ